MSEGTELQYLQNWYGITDNMAALALAYVECGVLRQAAKKTNYPYRNAKRLLSEHTGFRLAVNELLHILLTDDKVKARAVLRQMLDDVDQSAKTRTDAAKELWNRADGMPIQRTEKRDMDLDELSKEIKRLSTALALDKPRVLDGTAEVVENDDRKPETPPDSTGEVRREG